MTRRSFDPLRVSKPCPMGDQFEAKAGYCTVCDRDILEISAMTSEEVEAALSEPQTPCARPHFVPYDASRTTEDIVVTGGLCEAADRE